MSQTRFYVAESRVLAPRVSLFVGGLPPGRSPQEYSSLLDEAVASKGATAWAGPGAWPGGGQGGRPEGGCAGWAAWSPGCVPLLPRVTTHLYTQMDTLTSTHKQMDTPSSIIPWLAA